MCTCTLILVRSPDACAGFRYFCRWCAILLFSKTHPSFQRNHQGNRPWTTRLWKKTQLSTTLLEKGPSQRWAFCVRPPEFIKRRTALVFLLINPRHVLPLRRSPLRPSSLSRRVDPILLTSGGVPPRQAEFLNKYEAQYGYGGHLDEIYSFEVGLGVALSRAASRG